MAGHPIDYVARTMATPLHRRLALRMLRGALLTAIGSLLIRPRAGGAQTECDGATPDRCQIALTLVCVDVQRDTKHCGACGNLCDAGDQCVAGVCQPETVQADLDEPEQPDTPAVGATSVPPGEGDAADPGRTYESLQFGYRIRWRAPWEPDGVAQSIAGVGDTFSLVAGDAISRIYVGEAGTQTTAEAVEQSLERARSDDADVIVVQEYDAAASQPRLITRFEQDGTAYEGTFDAVALTDPPGILTVETRYPERTSLDYVRAIDAAVVVDLEI